MSDGSESVINPNASSNDLEFCSINADLVNKLLEQITINIKILFFVNWLKLDPVNIFNASNIVTIKPSFN